MNSTRWVVASFVAGAAAILVLAACGAGGPPPGSPEALYVDLGCAKCHGPDREGMRSGPPLHNLAQRWTDDDLMSYMRDPEAFVATNPRLYELKEQYPIAMPAFPNTPEEELRAVVDLMLAS
jgi:cytochrome c551/c552